MGYDGADIDGHTVVITNNLFYGMSGKGITGEAKIRRGAIIPWENEPGQYKTPISPDPEQYILSDGVRHLRRPSYRIGASSANWPQNDAFNNVTTSKKLVDSSTGSDEEKREVIGRWRMADNKLDADPLIDLKESLSDERAPAQPRQGERRAELSYHQRRQARGCTCV